MSAQCKIIVPDNEIDEKLYKYTTNEYRNGYVEIGDEKIVLPKYYTKIADDIENFEVRDTDIWIITHPKSGTTWCQEMTRLILNDLDYEDVKKDLDDSYNYIELPCILDFELVYAKFPDLKTDAVLDSVGKAKNDNRTPRLFKCHLPWCLLPKAFRNGTTKAKIIYVARNPKDTCVSYYHHQRLLEGFSGTFEDFYQCFLAGRIHYGPFWPHILGYWNRRNNDNLLFLKYADMKNDLPNVIFKVSKFLNKKLPSEEEMSKLVDHLSFEKMKINPYVNYENLIKMLENLIKRFGENQDFIRSGKVGAYKSEITPEIEKEFDQWIEENTKNQDIIL